MYDSSDFERLNNGFMSSSLLGYDKRLRNIRTPSVTDTRVHLDIRIWSEETIHHTNEECLFFETGRMNRIVLQTSHPDSNLDLSHRFLEGKTSANIHHPRTSKEFLKRLPYSLHKSHTRK